VAFSWRPSLQSSSNLFSTLLPKEVLYFFDAPMLFSSVTPEFPVLCYKTDEDQSISQYIVAQTNNSVIAKLKAGAMTVRSALSQPWLWVAEATDDYTVRRCAGMSLDEIPEMVLPERGYGLDPSAGLIVETGTTNSPFLTFKFTGNETEYGSLPFGIFKGMVDELYISILKIFEPALRLATPDISKGILRRALTVPTYEPAFGSLLIAIERPRLDFSHSRTKPTVDEALVERNIDHAYEGFWDSASAVAMAAAGKGELNPGLARDHFDTLDAVASLIPTTKSFFSAIQISGRAEEAKITRSVQIDAKSGDRIKEMFELASMGQRTIEGTIVETSERSRTFIIRDESMRETTCIAYTPQMRERFGGMRNGIDVRVHGTFQRRSRRDKLWVDRLAAERFTTLA
jgi:hypothetical protein